MTGGPSNRSECLEKRQYNGEFPSIQYEKLADSFRTSSAAMRIDHRWPK